jgi:alpha-L-fucosidase
MRWLRWFGAAVLLAAGTSRNVAQAADEFPVAPGPAAPDMETLGLYEHPAWFRDAKFGIRVLWGPQSIAELGDGYGQRLYIQGSRAYEYHVAHFGHPTKVGYKDVIARWTAEKFDPDTLVARFAGAGARYVVVPGAGEDNVDLWPSSHHRWNSVALGPKRDLVGAWAAAVRAKGLRFGVSEALVSAWQWNVRNSATDQDGPLAGQPYDRADPQFADLYFPPRRRQVEGLEPPPDGWAAAWYARVRELVDLHQPDLVSSHGPPSLGAAHVHLAAHFYNRGIEWRQEPGVYSLQSEGPGDAPVGIYATEEILRGSRAAIASRPWQCLTSLNDWIYDRAAPMRPARAVIHELADVVSKNGNLVLGVPLRGDGSLPDAAGAVLDEIGLWLAINGEAIYGTRPWRESGEGPTETIGGPGGENKTLAYTPEDVRYTAKTWLDDDGKERETLFAIVLGWPGPGEEVFLGALAAVPGARPIGTVRMLGYPEALRVLRDRDGLHILLPREAPNEHAIVFRID